MHKLLILAAALATLAVPAWAADDSGTVDSVSPSGDVMTLDSGNSYAATDGTDLSTWQDDDVTIGADTAFDSDTGDTASVEAQN